MRALVLAALTLARAPPTSPPITHPNQTAPTPRALALLVALGVPHPHRVAPVRVLSAGRPSRPSPLFLPLVRPAVVRPPCLSPTPRARVLRSVTTALTCLRGRALAAASLCSGGSWCRCPSGGRAIRGRYGGARGVVARPLLIAASSGRAPLIRALVFVVFVVGAQYATPNPSHKFAHIALPQLLQTTPPSSKTGVQITFDKMKFDLHTLDLLVCPVAVTPLSPLSPLRQKIAICNHQPPPTK